jgi:hypothetical protein
MVRESLGEVVEDKVKEGSRLIYLKSDGKGLVEEMFCRKYCLNNIPEVRQAISEFLGA